MSKVVLFESGMKGMGLTYHQSFLLKELSRVMASGLYVLTDGTEQETGLYDSLPELNYVDYSRPRELNDFFAHQKDVVVIAQSWGTIRRIKRFRCEEVRVMLVVNAYRHGSWKKYVAKMLIRIRYAKYIDQWINLSQLSRSDFLYGMKSHTPSVILNWGIEESFCTKAKYVFCINKQLSIQYSGDIKYVFYAAQFHRHKNHRRLIQTFSDILSENIYLVLCGDGEDLVYCMKLAKKLGLIDRIIFTGRLSRHIYMSHLRNASASIVLSSNETFGHTIIEPLSLSIPVISTNVGIAPEVIREGENGYIIPASYDMKLFKRLVQQSLTLNCINSRAFLDKERFSWNACALRIQQIVNECE